MYEGILCLALAVGGCSVFIVLCACVSERRKAGNERACRTKRSLLVVVELWSVRVSISVRKFANKVTKLEEWLLAPPVYSLRGTHA
jgi:hypothetical protein